MTKIRPRLLIGLVISGLALGLISSCAPSYNPRVNPRLHSNLAAAQNFIERALDRLTAAQDANDFDMSGHAAKAKSLLDQAYSEIKLAALAANAQR